MDVIQGADGFTAEAHDEIYIPNVFSPNGDGINDVFTVSPGPDLQILSMSGSIFDRWGNEVFSSAVTPFAWNGSFKGERLQPGVFVYLIEVKVIRDGETFVKIFSGDLTLLQ